jgi:hypothetical protein
MLGKEMKPIFELNKFPDGRLMLRVRFFRNSNFWILDLEQATWVPTLEEASFLKEVLDVVNERNEIKRALRKPSEDTSI